MQKMFLTEITLQDEYAARLFPANPYDWHRTVWSFFPDRDKRDFLYRVDSNPRGLRLLILSDDKPTSPLPEGSSVFKSREIPESFLSHRLYRFQLRVNPTKRKKTDLRTGERLDKGLRVPITDETELFAWLKRKGEVGGFSLPALAEPDSPAYQLSVLQEARLNFYKPGNKRAHHASVQFAGVLSVENPDLFKQTLKNGIGSAKSFGFGLLMLQPIN